MADLKDLARSAAREAARGDEATRAKRKKWLAMGAVGAGGVGLLVLWSLASKIGFYLLVFLFGAAFVGGLWYLLKGRWARFMEEQRAQKAEKDAVKAEADKQRQLEAQLEEMKRKKGRT